MSNDDNPVTVYKAANLPEAYLICNAIKEEGIDCQVTEANAAYVGMPFWSPQVVVRARDKERAREIIERIERERGQRSDAEEQQDDEQEDG